jgi:hypothetical protein
LNFKLADVLFYVYGGRRMRGCVHAPMQAVHEHLIAFSCC